MKKITLLFLIAIIYSFNSYGQNTCATATTVTAGTTTVPALSGGEIPLPECAANAGGVRSAGVWYSFTATVDGTANVTTDLPANAGGDTRVHIYSGTCATLTCIGGNDDVDGTNFLSDASFPVSNGTTYFIAWDDRWSAAGFDFDLTETTCTATAAPGAATAPTPADTATGVTIIGGAGVAFSWVEDATGDVAESFTISIGLNAAGDDIGSLAGLNSGGTINFGAANNTVYFWKIDAVNCFGSTTSAIWSFTTTACTETAVPACVTVFTPVDNEPTAQLGAGGSLTFTWDDVPTATSYELFINGVSQGVRASGITFTGFTVSTAFTWSVVPSNCFGAAIGCPTWNFTTSATLSIEDNEIAQPFKVYPNPTSGILNIKTSLDIDNIAVFNLLGQRVANFNQNSISNNSINLSELSQGLYIIKISAGDKAQTFKITKE